MAHRNVIPAEEKVNAQKLIQEKLQENLRAGAKLLFERKFEGAMLKLQKVLMLDPKNANAYALRSKCYLQLCDLKSAITNLNKAIILAPEEEDWPRQLSILMDAQGLNLLDQVRSKVAGWQGILERAIEFFTNAIEADSSEPFFWLHRAIAYTLRSSYTLAVSDLERYTALDAKNPEVYIMLAKLNWRLDAQHSGQVNLDKAHRLSPNHPEVQILKRSVAKRNQAVYQRTSRTLLSNDTEGTLEELDKALFVSPTNVNMLLLRAATHRKLGNLRESLADIKRAKDAYTRSVVEHRKLRHNTDGSQDFSQVEELPEMIIQRNNTLNEMALVEMKAGHVRAAWSIFNQVVQADEKLAQRDPKFTQSPLFLLNRGDAQRQAQNWPQAFEDYWRAMQLDPRNSETKSRIALVYNEFAVTQFNRKNYQKAALLYSKAIEMYPASSHLYLGRAKAQFYKGNLHGAREDLVIAVQKDPNNLEAAERLRQLTASSKSMVPTSNGQARRRGNKKPALVFPPLPHSSSLELKVLPGYGRRGEGVPPSFGSGFQVMPKADLMKAKIRNKLRTTRPVT